MTDVIEDDVQPDPGAKPELDPFSFIPDLTSVIRGLHGTDEPTDATYAFHTPYVPDLDGMVEVEVAFAGLRSRRDRLNIIVHGLDRSGTRLEVVTQRNVSLRTLAASGGRTSIRFLADPEQSYAIVGRTNADVDTTAGSLKLFYSVHPATDGDDQPPPQAAAVDAGTVRNLSALLCDRPPIFSAPIFQACTAAQLADPAFIACRDMFGRPGAADRRQWERAYIVQALKTYGVLTGAGTGSGVGFGDQYDVLAPAIARLGARTAAATALVDPDASQDSPDGDNDDGTQAGYLGLVALPSPRHLGQFDFLWSIGLCERLRSSMDMIFFVEDAIEYLRPGGIAVHILGGSVGTQDAVPPGYFDRNALSQLSLAVVAAGHDAAQLNIFTDADDTGPKSFGIVLRRN